MVKSSNYNTKTRSKVRTKKYGSSAYETLKKYYSQIRSKHSPKKYKLNKQSVNGGRKKKNLSRNVNKKNRGKFRGGANNFKRQ